LIVAVGVAALIPRAKVCSRACSPGAKSSQFTLNLKRVPLGAALVNAQVAGVGPTPETPQERRIIVGEDETAPKSGWPPDSTALAI
jgi:hypothetical protein